MPNVIDCVTQSKSKRHVQRTTIRVFHAYTVIMKHKEMQSNLRTRQKKITNRIRSIDQCNSHSQLLILLHNYTK